MLTVKFFRLIPHDCMLIACVLLATLASTAVYADKKGEPVRYSDWSFDSTLSYHQTLDAASIEFSLANAPWRDSGLMWDVGFEHVNQIELKAAEDASAVADTMDLNLVKLGVGYQWYLGQWQLSPKVSLLTSSGSLPNVATDVASRYADSGAVFGQLSMAAYYEFNSRWRGKFAINHLFADRDGIDGSAIGFSFNYRLGKTSVTRLNNTHAHTRQSELDVAVQKNILKMQASKREMAMQPSDQPQAILTAASPVMNSQEEFNEFPASKPATVTTPNRGSIEHADVSSSFTLTGYSVQLGSFQYEKSLEKFIKRHKLAREHLYLTKTQGYIRLLYGRYDSQIMAKIIAEQFSGKGIENLIVNLESLKIDRYQ